MNRLLLALAGATAALVAGAAYLALQEPPAAEEPRVIEVETSRYTFAPGKDEPIVVAAGETVTFRVTSLDVTHGFAIEGLHAGVEVPPGETVEVTVRFGAPGEHRIYCTVFCGADHPSHKGTVVVTG